jgi:hypothetical protein
MHGTTILLVPYSVTEGEEVVSHHDGESFKEGLARYVRKSFLVSFQVGIDDLEEARANFDAGIHCFGVGSEKSSAGGEHESVKVLEELVRAPEERALLGGDLLQLVVTPDSNGIQTCAGVGDDGADRHGFFVDFRHDIKNREGLVGIHKGFLVAEAFSVSFSNVASLRVGFNPFRD